MVPLLAPPLSLIDCCARSSPCLYIHLGILAPAGAGFDQNQAVSIVFPHM